MSSPLPLVLFFLLAAGAAAGQQHEPTEPPLGRGSSIRQPQPDDAPATIEVVAGTALREAPDPRSPTLAVIDMTVELRTIERRGGWGKVRFGYWSGWVPLAVSAGPGGSPLPPAAAPAVAALRPSSSSSELDSARLARARELLGGARDPMRLSPFLLYTDVAPSRTLDRFAAIGASLVAAYDERYGLSPGFRAPLAVVLFRHEAQYRAYEGAEAALVDLGAMGHAGNGIAALFLGGRRAAAVEPLLIHELTHLLNRAALGVATPPWLEEGLANDLAFSRVGPNGALELGTLSGASYVLEEVTRDPGSRDRVRKTLHVDGSIASAGLLAERAQRRELAPLELLTDLSWGEFAQPEGRQIRYSHSAFFVRFLLDGGKPALRQGFREFLAAAAAGGAADAPSLLAALDSQWDTLEEEFRRWVARLATAR